MIAIASANDTPVSTVVTGVVVEESVVVVVVVVDVVS
jgi:hypothetical protein